MTPETDPRQEVETVVTPGKGVRYLPTQETQIHLAQRRHPTMRAATRPASPAERMYADLPVFPIPLAREEDDLTAVARAVGMVDTRPRERREPGRWDRFLFAAAKALGVGR